MTRVSSTSPKNVTISTGKTGAARVPNQRHRTIRSDQAGVGPGLTIVKSITQAHDGILIIVPGPDGRIRVTAQLPARVRAANSVPAIAG